MIGSKMKGEVYHVDVTRYAGRAYLSNLEARLVMRETIRGKIEYEHA